MKKVLSKKTEGQNGNLVAYYCSCPSCSCSKRSSYNNVMAAYSKYSLNSAALQIGY